MSPEPSFAALSTLVESGLPALSVTASSTVPDPVAAACAAMACACVATELKPAPSEPSSPSDRRTVCDDRAGSAGMARSPKSPRTPGASSEEGLEETMSLRSGAGLMGMPFRMRLRCGQV